MYCRKIGLTYEYADNYISLKKTQVEEKINR